MFSFSIKYLTLFSCPPNNLMGRQYKNEIFAKRVKVLLFIDKDKEICDVIVPIVVVAA